MFRTVHLSIISSFSLNTQQWYMSYRFADSLWAGSGRNRFRPDPARKLSAHITLLCVQWKTLSDGQRNCPKHVEFYSKNKFEKLVHLVGVIIRIYHDARSPERQTVNTSWWWTANLFETCRGLLLKSIQRQKCILLVLIMQIWKKFT